MLPSLPRYAEFFAGAGMVRAALGDQWDLALANDIDPKKCRAYAANWGRSGLIEGDIAQLDPRLLCQPIDLYWASSPCQDLSLAGNRQGLAGLRSGVFHAWMEKVRVSRATGYAPKLLAFENVAGLLTSGSGRDFQDVLRSFLNCGYRYGVLEIDARHFLPHSRPRIFVVAVRADAAIAPDLLSDNASSALHTGRVRAAVDRLPEELRRNWIWWNVEPPNDRVAALSSIVDVGLNDSRLAVDTNRLLSMMDPGNRMKVDQAISEGGVHLGMVYKRGRPGVDGIVRQRAEIRFDGIAGCLRTPAGGSSRQTILVVRDGVTSARLLSTREAARLMGLPESYRLPEAYNEAYKLSGDGVAVPVVRFLRDRLFHPLLLPEPSRIAA